MAHPRVEIRTVTADLASEWLLKNKNNRDLRPADLRKYIQYMDEDEFFLSPDAIAFDVDDHLINGQHRLLGVQRTGKPQEFIVIYNLPRKAAHITDRGIRRTLRDSLTIMAGKTPQAISAMLPRFLVGADSADVRESIPRDEMAKIYTKYSKELNEVINLFQKKTQGIAKVSITAAVARAWVARPEERVRIFQFVEILKGSMPPGADSVNQIPVLLRKYLDRFVKADENGHAYAGNYSHSVRYEWYLKANEALKCFLDELPMNKLANASEENFPIEEDNEA